MDIRWNDKEISENNRVILDQAEEMANQKIKEKGFLSPIDVMNEIYQFLGIPTVDEITNAPWSENVENGIGFMPLPDPNEIVRFKV